MVLDRGDDLVPFVPVQPVTDQVEALGGRAEQRDLVGVGAPVAGNLRPGRLGLRELLLREGLKLPRLVT